MKIAIPHTNRRLKLTLFLIMGLLVSPHGLAKIKHNELSWNNEGYPYNLLIQRTDQVKLIYQGDKDVTCRVEIQIGDQQWLSDTHKVSLKKFEQRPLSSCLTRPLAKQILASTF